MKRREDGTDSGPHAALQAERLSILIVRSAANDSKPAIPRWAALITCGALYPKKIS
jgi:hypothetical protein